MPSAPALHPKGLGERTQDVIADWLRLTLAILDTCVTLRPSVRSAVDLGFEDDRKGKFLQASAHLQVTFPFTQPAESNQAEISLSHIISPSALRHSHCPRQAEKKALQHELEKLGRDPDQLCAE
ncbi:hypothetical protein R3I94_012106 [Phoxinus phoxinus]